MKGGAAVADDETTEPAEDTAPSNAELAGRVDGLESKLDMILDKLGGQRDRAHDAAQQHTEERLDRPSTVAEEIRAQLEAQRAKDAAKAREDGNEARVAALEATVTGMAEKVPETPPRRIERIMWGAR